MQMPNTLRLLQEACAVLRSACRYFGRTRTLCLKSRTSAATFAISRFSKLLLLPLLLASPLCFAEAASEAAVKVAFLYNFFKFIEWPETVTGQNRYTLCLSNHTDFGDHLLMLEGKAVNGKPLEIIRNISAKDLKSCHILFIDIADNPGDYARELKGMPIVTVSDKPGFINQGGTIGLIQDGNRLSFEVNLDIANTGNTRISAQLLKLAKNIVTDK
ncbi:YfiR family protein [Methylomonas sp. 2BW1-5-20]|uniref:YfiR family protein n=1 Tax=Methylomonas sp. 2BW1-5-20 TaxID=3376686 RepID=UPI00404C187C